MRRQAIMTLTVAIGPRGARSGRPSRRQDVIWARATGAAITLDGVLDEPAWAAAESMIIPFGEDAGIPGSGWKIEGGWDPDRSDLRHAEVPRPRQPALPRRRDRGRVRRRQPRVQPLRRPPHGAQGPRGPGLAPSRPRSTSTPGGMPRRTDPQPAGQLPAFSGRWADWPPGLAAHARADRQLGRGHRRARPLQRRRGHSTRATPSRCASTSTPMGYDVTQPDGDIVEWNISIYDCDWFWPLDALQFSSNRVWWQCPWGNAAWYNEVRIHRASRRDGDLGPRADVAPETGHRRDRRAPRPSTARSTRRSGATPTSTPSTSAGTTTRCAQTYDGVGPYRAGQYQPPVNGGRRRSSIRPTPR